MRITLLDTSLCSSNLGDEIIMESLEEELNSILKDSFVLRVPTHLYSFGIAECIGKLPDVANEVYNSKYKFIGGSNLLLNDMFNRTNQWNINIFNSKPIKGSILVGCGGGGELNWYTKKLYQKVLSKHFIHSVRNARAYEMISSLGLKCINTGCVSMWKLTPELCKNIPNSKSSKVVFTLTDYNRNPQADKLLIDSLVRNYDEVFFWQQGIYDYQYLIEIVDLHKTKINIMPPHVSAYHNILTKYNIDYIGTRFHAGMYAMRHKRRSIIVCIDDRMNSMADFIPNNTITRQNAKECLTYKINSQFNTLCNIDWNGVSNWKKQFE